MIPDQTEASEPLYRVMYRKNQMDPLIFSGPLPYATAQEKAIELKELGYTVPSLLAEQVYQDRTGPQFVRYIQAGRQRDSAIVASFETARRVADDVEEDETVSDIQILPARLHPSHHIDRYQVLYMENLPLPSRGSLSSQVEMLTEPMSYQATIEQAEFLAQKPDMTVVAILTETAARERETARQNPHDVVAEVDESLYVVPEQGADSLLPQDPTDEQMDAFEGDLRDDDPDEGEPWRIAQRRQQAMEWAIRLMEARAAFKGAEVVPNDLSMLAQIVLGDAKAFLGFLEGTDTTS